MTPTATAETEILSRVIGAENPDFTPAAARSILRLKFEASDRVRMDELAEKSRTGTLSDIEATQLEAYLFVGSILDLMQSRARQTLAGNADGPDGQ